LLSDVLGLPNFYQKLARDEPEAGPTSYTSDCSINFPNGCPSKDLAAPIINPAIDVHAISTDSAYMQPFSINIFLVSNKKSQGSKANYLLLNVISPYHLVIKQEKKTWVIESYGQFRGYGHPG
jgi:hypothetical protein